MLMLTFYLISFLIFITLTPSSPHHTSFTGITRFLHPSTHWSHMHTNHPLTHSHTMLSLAPTTHCVLALAVSGPHRHRQHHRHRHCNHMRPPATATATENAQTNQTELRPHGQTRELPVLPRSESTSEFMPLEEKEVEYFFASDASAVIEHTNRVIYLEVRHTCHINLIQY